MPKLTQKQQELFNLVIRKSGSNTHELAQARGDRQAYESFLRNRLFVLVRLGLITCKEKN